MRRLALVPGTSNLWTMTAANGLTRGQHALVPGGLPDDGRALIAALGGNVQIDLERPELGRHPV